jgi:hypothetical protein
MSVRLFSLQLRAHSQDGPLKVPVNKALNVVCLTPRSPVSPCPPSFDQSYTFTLFTERKGELFPSYFVLKYLRTFKFAYEEPEQTALNRTVRNQIKTCNAKSTCAKKSDYNGRLELNGTAISLDFDKFLNMYLVSETGSLSNFWQRNS